MKSSISKILRSKNILSKMPSEMSKEDIINYNNLSDPNNSTIKSLLNLSTLTPVSKTQAFYHVIVKMTQHGHILTVNFTE